MHGRMRPTVVCAAKVRTFFWRQASLHLGPLAMAHHVCSSLSVLMFEDRKPSVAAVCRRDPPGVWRGGRVLRVRPGQLPVLRHLPSGAELELTWCEGIQSIECHLLDAGVASSSLSKFSLLTQLGSRALRSCCT